MLLAARNAVNFCEGLTRQQFEQDVLHQNAIVKAVEIVGEAASRLSAETRERLPEIAWDKVIGMRHRLVHDYFAVDYDIVWDVVQNDMPQLISQLETIVPPEPGQPN
ncbi:MAG: DUF86 domain-containing protein [Gammaproteobacteria bacterium]|nr:DUF86 domain-containing protein [Gammaproteobacteria bacterium]